MQIIDKLLGIDKLKQELKAYQSTTTLQFYNQIYPSWQSHKALQVFHIEDTIFSVVHKLAKTAAKIPIYGYNDKGEDLPETDKLVLFLRTLTYAKKLELFTWLFLVDRAFCYKEKTLGVNGTVERMVFLNPDFVQIAVTTVFPEEIAYYIYRDPNTGFSKRLELDEVIYIKGFNPTSDPYEKWFGCSKVEVLRRRITRMEGNMENSVAMMQNGGVPGVLYVEGLQHNAQAKPIIGALQENYKSFSTNPDNKGAAFVQPGKMGWLPMGLSMVDLDSAELAKLDLKGVCNVWGVSDTWFNSDSASTESNVKEMIRQAYTNGVMPITQLVEDAFNVGLVIDFGSGIRTIRFDFSDVEELQTSLKEKIEAMASAPVMIPNDVLEAMGYDRIDNELMDQPLIKTGYQPIDDFEPLPPVE